MQPSDIAGLVLAALSVPRTAEVTNLFLRPFQKS
jgi:NADP-dependent 3-hydroxy acid dehydrogenase YdfG